MLERRYIFAQQATRVRKVYHLLGNFYTGSSKRRVEWPLLVENRVKNGVGCSGTPLATTKPVWQCDLSAAP